MPLEPDPAIVSAASGLIGALVGGAISASVTWILELQRWKREDTSRFHAERLDLYANLNRAAARIVSLLVSWDAPPEPGEAANYERSEDLWTRLHTWADIRERVRLIASPSLVEKSNEMNALFDRAAEVDEAGGDTRRKEIRNELIKLNREFTAIARKELGTNG